MCVTVIFPMSSIEETFDDNKKMGSIITLVALISVVMSIFGIILSAAIYNVNVIAAVLMMIGTIIYAYLSYQFGVELRDNSADKAPIPFITNVLGPFIDHSHSLTRASIFAGIVKLMGMGLIIVGIFYIISSIVVGLGVLIGGYVLLVVIGFVFLWASREILIGGSHSFMWILLVILFALALIGSLFLLVSGLVALSIVIVAMGLMLLILSGYALYLALSNEVKAQMGT
jgi:hypothetical protein